MTQQLATDQSPAVYTDVAAAPAVDPALETDFPGYGLVVVYNGVAEWLCLSFTELLVLLLRSIYSAMYYDS